MPTSRKVAWGVGIFSAFMVVSGRGVAYADWLHNTFHQLWTFIQAL